jgi:hypothetical protein
VSVCAELLEQVEADPELNFWRWNYFFFLISAHPVYKL